jgi:hypothetical protein
MSTFINSKYGTGWLPGDIKGVFLADTDDTDLVGSGELLTNSTFDDGLNGWVDFSEGAGSISVADGRLSLVNGGSVSGDNEGMIYQIVPTVVGQRYQVIADKVSGSSIVQIGQAAGASNYFQSGNDSDDVLFSFVALGTATFITIRAFSANVTAIVERVSAKIADADRSVNNRGLVVNGTITREAVATGAGLVAYSGFSPSNYLERPYNSALDFGTGDFCVMGWAKSITATASTQSLIMIDDGSFSLRLGRTTSGDVTFPNSIFLQLYGDGGNINLGAGIQNTMFALGRWHQIILVRRNGVTELYMDGTLRDSYSTGYGDFITASSTMKIGTGFTVTNHEMAMALWRISATAPTAGQIRRIYDDEKALFQENAACTLYGASDAVTALAHDPDTGLLHVGTSAGRSVFQGLRRVANTTVPVTTAISAAGGMVVEE